MNDSNVTPDPKAVAAFVATSKELKAKLGALEEKVTSGAPVSLHEVEGLKQHFQAFLSEGSSATSW